MRLDLRAKRDSQTWRIEFPQIDVRKDPAGDAKVTVLAPRSHFNELAKDGRLQHWRDAYQNGYVRAAGQPEIMKLIGNVIERHEKRQQVRSASSSADRGPPGPQKGASDHSVRDG